MNCFNEAQLDKPNSKRKRTVNTSCEQYEIYLETLENDKIMRSGTINPTVEENYLSNKWEDLANKLNSLGTGPVLSAENWKKRFKDWKNATRAKYTKIKEGRIATGGGVAERIVLTPLEERGLDVWGRVAVTGTPLVEITGGLGKNISTVPKHSNDAQSVGAAHASVNDVVFVYSDRMLNESSSDAEEPAIMNALKNKKIGKLHISASTDPFLEDITPTPSTSNSQTSSKIGKRKTKGKKFKVPKSLGQSAEELKDCYKETNVTFRTISNELAKFSKIYETVHTKKNEIEEKKLNFEIKKFQFENEMFTNEDQ